MGWSWWLLGVLCLSVCYGWVHPRVRPRSRTWLGGKLHEALPNGKGFLPSPFPMEPEPAPQKPDRPLTTAEKIKQLEQEIEDSLSLGGKRDRTSKGDDVPRRPKRSEPWSKMYAPKGAQSDARHSALQPQVWDSFVTQLAKKPRKGSASPAESEQDSAEAPYEYSFRRPSPADSAMGKEPCSAPEPVQQASPAAASMTHRKKEVEQPAPKPKKAPRPPTDEMGYRPFQFQPESNEYVDQPSSEYSDLFSAVSFEQLGVEDPTVLANLRAMGLSTATVTQTSAIPALLASKSIILHAHTGSGKTLAYLLPLFSLVDPRRRTLQAVVLAPGRELAAQIGRVAQRVFHNTSLSLVTLIGGANIRSQLADIKEKHPQIVIATPGRLAEVVFRYEKLHLSAVRAMVLDEADQLLQPPYADDAHTLWDATALRSMSSNTSMRGADRNADVVRAPVVCLASATAKDSPAVKSFAERSPVPWDILTPTARTSLPRCLTHALYSCPRMHMFEGLRKILRSQPTVHRAMVFVNDPHRVQIVCDALLEHGLVAAPLHGETKKEDRKEVMTRMRDGRLRIVVTTELAARGLDLPDLSHVINLDLPSDPLHYVHRAGRCGRLGRRGLVISLATAETKHVLRRFAKRLGIHLEDCQLRSGQIFLRRR